MNIPEFMDLCEKSQRIQLYKKMGKLLENMDEEKLKEIIKKIEEK